MNQPLKIKSVEELNFRSFRNYRKKESCPEFGKRNLLFGWNGSGKTALADILYALQNNRPELLETENKNGGTKFKISTTNHGDLTLSDLGNFNLNLRVFNRQYVKDNLQFFEDPNKAIRHIAVIGEESIELRRMKDELDRVQNDIGENERAKGGLKKEIEYLCTTGAKIIKDALQPAGIDPYRNYDRRNFEQKCRDIQDIDAQKSDGDGDENEISKILERVRLPMQNRISLQSYQPPDAQELYDKVKEITEREVIAAVIEKLSGDTDLNVWVKRGLEIHQNSEHPEYKEECQFCGQAMPENRLEDLERHFSEAYQQLQKDCAQLIQKLDGITNSIEHLSQTTGEIRASISPSFQQDMELEIRKFSDAVETDKTYLANLKTALQNKAANPFQPLPSFPEQADLLSGDIWGRIQNLIGRHNEESDDHQKSTKEACEKYEMTIIVKSYSDWKNKGDKMRDLNQALDNLSQHKGDLERKIREEPVPETPIEKINENLHYILGHNTIAFQAVSDTGYHIIRDSHDSKPAKDLSEGEKTAVALVYFLHSLDDKDFDKKTGVVVIDDPVCSLDQNIIFGASLYLNQQTEGVHQLFILTHNIQFRDEVRGWYPHFEQNPKNEANLNLKTEEKLKLKTYEILRDDYAALGDNGASIIEYVPRWHAKSHQTDFYSLWLTYERKEIRRTPIGNKFNQCRKVLEEVLRFKLPQERKKTPLIDLLESEICREIPEATKSMIRRYINRWSHAYADSSDLSENPASSLRSLIDSVFQVVAKIDKQHFDGMQEYCRNFFNTPNKAQKAVEKSQIGDPQHIPDALRGQSWEGEDLGGIQ